MAIHYEEFNTTAANWVADTKAVITTSTDWTNITGDIVKATTTRGAEMVVNLGKAATTNNYATIAVWKTHNGSTGTFELTRYLHWKYQSAGTTANAVHVVVSASKEHLVIQVEGPYGTESNYDTADTGSKRTSFIMADIVPYHAADTVEAVAFFSAISTTQAATAGNQFMAVSANQADDAAWIPATLCTVQPIMSQEMGSYHAHSLQHVAKGDGKTYLFPYVIVENVDGLRGRLNNVYSAGWNKPNFSSEGPGLNENDIVTYDSADYIIKRITRGLNSSSTATYSPFGDVAASNSNAWEPLIAIKKT